MARLLRLLRVFAAASLLLLAFGPGAVRAAPGGEPPSLPPGVRFLHTGTAANITGDWSALDYPALNGHPEALIFATNNVNPGGSFALVNNREVGVYYGSFAGAAPGGASQWKLYNEDGNFFYDGLDYNIMAAPPGTQAFIHTTTVTNTTGNATYLDHPLLNGNHAAIVFVQHTASPGGVATGPAYTQTVGVWYDTGLSRWSIFNQAYTVTMPAGTSFNVLVAFAGPQVFTHIATLTNTIGIITLIDHPLTNGNPQARLLVTQNWNPPPQTSGVYNNHPIAAYYSATYGRWAVDDINTIVPIGAAFNILIDEFKVYLPAVHRP